MAQKGDIIDVTAPSGGVKVGDVIELTNRCAIALEDADAGAEVGGQVEGVVDVAKATGSGNNIAQDADLYWDGSKATTDASGNTPMGYAVAAAGESDATVACKLKG